MVALAGIFGSFFWQAILLCPQSIEDQKRFLTESIELLKGSSPSKHAVAERLYFTATGAVVEAPLEEEYTLKQELLLALSPEFGLQAVATPVESDPLLAQCFGNRSAVLCEMKMYKVSGFITFYGIVRME